MRGLAAQRFQQCCGVVRLIALGLAWELWLARRLGGHPPLHPELDDVYDASETPRRARGTAAILDQGAAHHYLRIVRARSLEVLAACDLAIGDDPLTREGFVFEMVAEHEAQHTETVLQALQMLPAGAYLPPARRPLPEPDARGASLSPR